MRVYNRVVPLFCVIVLFLMAGIRQQLGLDAHWSTATVIQATDAKERGGIRQRTFSSKPESKKRPAEKEPGIRKRLNLGSNAALQAPPTAPLTASLVKSWARGRTTTSDALTFARDAKKSGASNLGAVSENTTGKNNFRKFKRAAGQPLTPISYIEIPKGQGGFCIRIPLLILWMRSLEI